MRPFLANAGWRLAAGVGAVLIAILACGKTSHNDERAPDTLADGPGASDFVAWDAARRRAACEREVRCGRYASAEACFELTLDGIVPGRTGWYEKFFGGVDLLAELAAEYSLADEATRDACLAEIAAGACNPGTFYPASCDRALVARNPRENGESCAPSSLYLPNLPCRDGLTCELSSSCRVCAPAVAVPRMSEGDPCLTSEECEPGLFCTAATQPKTCARLPEVGELCGESACASGDCVGSVCVPIVGAGEPCGDIASCQRDFVCDGTCVPRKLAGASCPRFPASPADYCAGYCMFDEPDATEGTCGYPSDAAPAPCPLYSSGSWYCPAKRFMDTRGDTILAPSYCMCLPQLPLGAACESIYESFLAAGQCASGACTDGVCATRLVDGSACTAHPQCASDHCDASGTCSPPCQPVH